MSILSDFTIIYPPTKAFLKFIFRGSEEVNNMEELVAKAQKGIIWNLFRAVIAIVIYSIMW